MHNEINLLKNQALLAIQAGKISEGIDVFLQALKIDPTDFSLHNNLGNAYKQQQAYHEAIHHYQEAIRLNSDYAEAHHNLANVLAQKDDYSTALHHYRLAVHLAPDYMLAHYHLGLLLLTHNQKHAAETQFKNVVELCPDHLFAHFYLGILALDDHRFSEAEKSFKTVLTLHPEHIDTLVNLGVIALKQEENQLAIHYFTQALALDEHHVDARHNLAATFIHHDRFENALTHYSILLDSYEDNIEYLYNAGVAEMALGHLTKAQTHFEKILKLNSEHFSSLINLAAIHSRLNRTQEAILLLRKAQTINPMDPSCRYMLNALEGIPTSSACPEYAKNLFDNYALYYDTHLQDTLHYTLPQQIGKMLHQLIPSLSIKHTLDLGCGTGLSGVTLREMSEQLTGVDLSQKMLQQARAKGIYDELIESELVNFLQQSTQSFQVIVSADVLPYLGNLADLFNAITLRLEPLGLFIFNTEISLNEPWKLQKSARFSHSANYIETLAKEHGLNILRKEAISARQQSGQDVPFFLYVLQVGS